MASKAEKSMEANVKRAQRVLAAQRTPTEKRIDGLTRKLAEANNALVEWRDQYNDIRERMASYIKRLEEFTAKAEKLEKDLALAIGEKLDAERYLSRKERELTRTREHLVFAKGIISALRGTEPPWEQQATQDLAEHEQSPQERAIAMMKAERTQWRRS